MYTLECYRIITSVAGWIVAGEFPTIDLALEGILNTGYALEYRIKSPSGDYHEVDWVDHTDSMGGEYCLPVLGPACNNWPQFVGNVK